MVFLPMKFFPARHQNISSSINVDVGFLYVVKPVDFNSFSVAVAELGCYWLLLNKLPPEPVLETSPAH